MYKRQGISQDLQSLEAELEFMDDYILPQLRTIDAINPAAVSYTHLDVYKRQILHYLADIKGGNV